MLALVSFGTRLKTSKILHSTWKVLWIPGVLSSHGFDSPGWELGYLFFFLHWLPTAKIPLPSIAQMPKELLLVLNIKASQGKPKFIQSLSTDWRNVCILKLWNVSDAMPKRRCFEVSLIITLILLIFNPLALNAKFFLFFSSSLPVHAHANTSNQSASSISNICILQW